MSEIVIYQDAERNAQVEVRLEDETLWLSLNQISTLFERDKSVISRHLNNVFKDKELDRNSVVAKNATTATDGKTYQVDFYNLDAILSVGYRVNSKRGTQFRIWSTRILKEHLVQGYTLNEKRLQEKREQVHQLYASIRFVERSLLEQAETIDDARKIVHVLSEFATGLNVLDDYDHERLETSGNTQNAAVHIPVEEFLSIVVAMRRDFDSDVFAQPKDASFDSSVSQIYQSFNGSELYPSVEAKAVMLL